MLLNVGVEQQTSKYFHNYIMFIGLYLNISRKCHVSTITSLRNVKNNKIDFVDDKISFL